VPEAARRSSIEDRGYPHRYVVPEHSGPLCIHNFIPWYGVINHQPRVVDRFNRISSDFGRFHRVDTRHGAQIAESGKDEMVVFLADAPGYNALTC